MHRAISTTLGVAALLAVPATASADSVIVKYKTGETRGAVNERAGVTDTVGTVAATGAKVVQVAGDAKAAAATLSRSAAVEYAEPNLELRAFATPDDARFGELYGLDNPANDADMDAPEGWDAAGIGGFPSGGGVKVGIVDTGIDAAHEDLAGKTVECAAVQLLTNAVREGTCTDQNDHGTHVAGTIAAKANNGVGVAGVSFHSQLAICRALNALGSGTTAGVANCITYLAGKGVKIISMSLGGGSSTTLQTAVRNASSRGTLIIAAAGNDGDATLNYPAAYPEVVSVAATDRNDARASFSNANADVEIAAAGVDVLSTKRGGGYVAFSGTSMATPHVAGVAAIIAARNPSFSGTQIRAKLQTSVDDLGIPGRDPQFGFGRVNLAKAAS